MRQPLFFVMRNQFNALLKGRASSHSPLANYFIDPQEDEIVEEINLIGRPLGNEMYFNKFIANLS